MKRVAFVVSSLVLLLGVYWWVCPYRILRLYWLEFDPHPSNLVSIGRIAQPDHDIEMYEDWIYSIESREHYRTYSAVDVPKNAIDFRIVYKGPETDLQTFSITEVVATQEKRPALPLRRIQSSKQIERSEGQIFAICEAWTLKSAIIGDGMARVTKSVVRDSAIKEFPREKFSVEMNYTFRGSAHTARFLFEYRTALRMVRFRKRNSPTRRQSQRPRPSRLLLTHDEREEAIE